MKQLIQWWPFSLLLLAVFASTWLTFTVNNHPLVEHEQEARNPDSFAEQVNITHMDKTGNPAAKLYSPLLTHQPLENKTFLTSPVITIFMNHQSPWMITSEQGQLKNGLEQVDLSGHVKMSQTEGPHNPPITLLTEAVTFYPTTQIATTDLPVNVQEPGATVNATGLNANLLKGTLELKSNMRGTYVKP